MTKLFRYSILLLLLGFCSVSMANATDSKKEKAISGMPIFIDTRLMVLAHPLFNAFDPKTQRFKGTSSESFINDIESRKKFIDKIKEIEDYLLKSPENLKNKLKKIPFKDRIAVEREYLIEKRILEAKLKVMKQRVYFSNKEPLCDGMTPNMSIYPQCSDIVETVYEISNELKRKYNTQIVIDVANILPINKPKRSNNTQQIDNILKEAYKKDSNLSSEDIKKWIKKADCYWGEKLGIDADIIPFGAIDTRLESIKLMEEKGKFYKIWDWEK